MVFIFYVSVGYYYVLIYCFGFNSIVVELFRKVFIMFVVFCFSW